MPGDHEAVDARELLQGQRAEQRHPLQRDELLHMFTESVRRSFRRFADPLVGVLRERFELGMRQGTCQDGIERLRFEQPCQRSGEPTRAEV